MNAANPSRLLIRFGAFQCDPCTGELRKGDRKVHLSDQPFRLLAILLERPGEVVTRQELRERLWSGQNFGEFDDGLNTAINKIRSALDDKAEKPRFIETIPRRGYRFIASVEVQPAAKPCPVEITEAPLNSPQTGADADGKPPSDSQGKPRRQPAYQRRLARAVFLIGALAWLLVLWWFTPVPRPGITHIDQVTASARIDIPVKPVSAGGHVYYIARAGGHWNMMRTWVGEGDGQRLAGPGVDPVVLDVSPDASHLLLSSTESPDGVNQLWTMPAEGGAPEPLGVKAFNDAAYSPGGERIAYIHDNALWFMDANGGNARRVASLPHAASWLAWSPRGRRLCFTAGALLSNAATSLWQISSDGRNLHQLLPGWSHPPAECCGSWTPDGRYFIFTSSHSGSSNLWALRERGSFWRRSPRGPFELTFGPDSPWGGTPSRDGRYVFFYNGIWRSDMQSLDLKTKQFSPFRPAGHSMVVAFSRDGQWIAYNDLASGVLVRSRGDGTDPIELAPAGMNPSFPRWSPDGKWIAFDGVTPGQPAKSYVVSADGGTPQPLFPSGGDMRDVDWSGDGKSLVVSSAADPRGRRGRKLLLVDFADRRTREIPGSDQLAMCRWSPDGRYISATTEDGTQLKLWDTSAQANRKWRAIARGSDIGISVWSPDSRYLYFQDLLGEGEPLLRYDVQQERVEPVADFSEILKSGVSRCALLGVTPEGSPFVAFSRSFSDLFAAKVILP